MQGAPSNNSSHRLATIDDLDALFAQHSLAPAVVKLAGHSYNVRTDLTAAEANLVLELMRAGLDAQGFTVLVDGKSARDKLTKAWKAATTQADDKPPVDVPAGPNGVRLNAVLVDLPQMHSALASARVLRASKVLAQYALTDDQVYAKYEYTPPVDGVPVGDDRGESSAS
jgi:hypothetical protein